MRAVLQRVTQARVTIGDAVVGRLDEPGLCVLLGIASTDTASGGDRMAAKIHQLRILRDDRSVADTGAPVLIVSQFTLYADTGKGRRPSWNAAARAELAEPLVDHVVRALRFRGARVETGRFGGDMQLFLVNDGPVTVIVEVD